MSYTEQEAKEIEAQRNDVGLMWFGVLVLMSAAASFVASLII